MKPTVRPAEPADRDGWLGLYRDAFGTPFSKAVFDWKYGADPSRLVVAAADGDVVGAAGSFRVPLSVAGTPIEARHPTDVMVREEYRGAPLFAALLDADDDAPLTFGTPTTRMRPVWEALRDWSFDRVDLAYRVQRPAVYLGGRSVPATLAERAAALAGVGLRGALRVRDALAPLGNADVARTDGYRHDVFAALPTDAPVALRDDRDYWTWRTADPRLVGRTFWVGGPGAPLAALYAVRERAPTAGWTVALARTADQMGGERALRAAYGALLADARSAPWIRVPAPLASDAVRRAAGLTHTSLVRALARSDLAAGLGVDLENAATRLVGYRWRDGALSADAPPSAWEFSDLLVP